MRAYGLPRDSNVEWPDAVDAAYFGLPSKHGKRKASSKRRTRRIWKKKERAKAQKEIQEENLTNV